MFSGKHSRYDDNNGRKGLKDEAYSQAKINISKESFISEISLFLFLSPRNCWLLAYLYTNMFFLLQKFHIGCDNSHAEVLEDACCYGSDCDVTNER